MLDDLPHDHRRQLRTRREQAIEFRLAQAHQYAVANGHDRCPPRLTGDEAHLAHDLAAPHFAAELRRAILVVHV
jgi:hypothetical protein